jgi:CheY-like chemotaxis protein
MVRYFETSDNGTKNDQSSGLSDRLKILIVDDDKYFLEALSFKLMKEGMNCVSVESGAEAIEVVNKVSFDLILLDVFMSEMNGLETYQKLRDLNLTCPIIFMSAHYDKYEGGIQKIEGIKPFAFLKKPFDFDQLRSLILAFGGNNEKRDNSGN